MSDYDALDIPLFDSGEPVVKRKRKGETPNMAWRKAAREAIGALVLDDVAFTIIDVEDRAGRAPTPELARRLMRQLVADGTLEYVEKTTARTVYRGRRR